MSITVARTRRCPHGIVVGPLDDYGAEADTPVCSTYCDKCEALWVAGKHPAQLFAGSSMSITVYVIQGTCGDYYCGCGGPGHLIGVASTRERAEEIVAAGEAAQHRYLSGDEGGRLHRTYDEIDITEVALNDLPPLIVDRS